MLVGAWPLPVIVLDPKRRNADLWQRTGVFIIVSAGCASKPRADWNQRIGHYTYEQAVQELGPLFASTQLQDGTVVSEWFLKYGPQFSFGLGTGFIGGHTGVGVGQTVNAPPKGHYLRPTSAPTANSSVGKTSGAESHRTPFPHPRIPHLWEGRVPRGSNFAFMILGIRGNSSLRTCLSDRTGGQEVSTN
ncbi:MAG TPA: hypothetical protein VEC99_19290 [Clostridia bacterium]|nr:hypothetical protein [Clostridia bacterium]